MATNNRAVVTTGRGGVGNVRKTLKLDVSSSSHPQTASILAQHEAASLEYEREVMKRNREAKANTPRVIGRGGIGNITESYPRNVAKPLRRASLFKGKGAVIVPVSPVNDIFDMNAYDDEERRKYAHDMGLRRLSGRRSLASLNGPGSGGNSPLSPDSEYSESDMGSTSSISVRSLSTANLAFPESPTSSPTSPSKDKHGLSALWKKVAKSKQAHSRDQNHDLLLRTQMAVSPSQRSFNRLECIHDLPDFPVEPGVSQEVFVGHAI